MNTHSNLVFLRVGFSFLCSSSRDLQRNFLKSFFFTIFFLIFLFIGFFVGYVFAFFGKSVEFSDVKGALPKKNSLILIW